MSTRMQTQVKTTPKPSFTPVQSGLLQRKCACGGTAGMSEECEECRKKKRFGPQTKLKVNEPRDIYEQEADRVADQVMATPAGLAVSAAPPRIQRFSGQSNGQMDAAPASVDQVLASPGKPLEAALRQDMEQRFGHDFSRVRVHSGVVAEQSAQDVNARAYTVGHNMVFGAGQFAPGTHEGQRVIAHELTHVVQQSSGADGIRAGQSDEKCALSPISDPYALGADIVYGAGELQGVNRLAAHELAHVAHRGLAAEPNVIRRSPGDGPERSTR